MPAYKANFSTKTPIELEFAFADGEPVGSLKIKPSTLLWKQPGAKKYRSVPIERFNDWIQSKGARARPVQF